MYASSSVGQLTHNSSGMVPSIWILDSGAFHHMSPDSSRFTSMSHSYSIHVMTTDGTPMPLAGVGFVATPNLYKTREISNLWKNGKIVISVKKSEIYSLDLGSQKIFQRWNRLAKSS